MLKIRTILHPTDCSTGSGPALGHAAGWTRRFGAALHLLHVMPCPGSCRIETLDDAGVGGLVSPPLHAAIARRMEDALRAARADDLPVQGFVAQSPLPAGAVLSHARAVDADLIVMGRGGGSSGGSYLGSTAAEVMRRSSCPVLLIDESRDSGGAPHACRRLAVYVDRSQDARELFDFAAALVGRYGADVDLLSVLPAMPGESPSIIFAENAGTEGSRAAAPCDPLHPRTDRLFRTATAHGAVLREHVGRGHPSEVLAAFVRRHASDLLLMLAPGLSTTEYAPAQASAERIVRHAACPVLLLNPSGKPLVKDARASGRESVPPQPRLPAYPTPL